MKVLITGIAGFIGFHTARKFHELGHDVVGIDNFNDYYDPDLKLTRSNILRDELGIDTYYKSISHPADYQEVEYVFEHEKPDLVIHLAAMAGVRYSMDHPQEYIDNNLTGTANIITFCEKFNVQNVIYASTSCVMSGHEVPWDEKEFFYKQINPYGYTKMINESQFHISKIPNAVGLRFFTVYGPYGRPDMALFDFTKNILAGNEITLYNYGDMKRDFTYIDDVVQGIVLVSQNMTERDLYCIGNGEQVELERFVDAIEKTLGVKAKRNYGPKHPADAKETWSDTTKLQKLGYRSTTPIEEGVAKFVEWYKSYYG